MSKIKTIETICFSSKGKELPFSLPSEPFTKEEFENALYYLDSQTGASILKLTPEVAVAIDVKYGDQTIIICAKSPSYIFAITDDERELHGTVKGKICLGNIENPTALSGLGLLELFLKTD